MSIEAKVGMTLEEADALPRTRSPEGAYEHISKYFTCPLCCQKLEPSRVEHSSRDDITKPGIERTVAILAAGCNKCKTLYRFEEDPIVRTDIW
jgi:transcription elongation factor Elf1